MTTDDESGLSQLAALKQSIEDVLKENEALLGTAKTDIDKAGYRGKVIAYMYVLWLVEAASEKYRQSRKSLSIVLQERKESYERNLADPTIPHSEKRAIASWLNELEHIMNLIQDVQKLEEAKPDEDSK